VPIVVFTGNVVRESAGFYPAVSVHLG